MASQAQDQLSPEIDEPVHPQWLLRVQRYPLLIPPPPEGMHLFLYGPLPTGFMPRDQETVVDSLYLRRILGIPDEGFAMYYHPARVAVIATNEEGHNIAEIATQGPWPFGDQALRHYAAHLAFRRAERGHPEHHERASRILATVIDRVRFQDQSLLDCLKTLSELASETSGRGFSVVVMGPPSLMDITMTLQNLTVAEIIDILGIATKSEITFTDHACVVKRIGTSFLTE